MLLADTFVTEKAATGRGHESAVRVVGDVLAVVQEVSFTHVARQGVVVESTLAMRDKVGEVFRLSHQTGQTIVVDCSAAVQGDQGHGDGGHGDVPGGAVRGGDRS